MPGARGVKRTASKASSTAAASVSKNKKKRGVQLEIPTALKRKGRVLTCGQGDVGQLGLGEDVIETSRFKHVSALTDNIVDICAGGMHTVALDSDGKVWTWGCNDEGALGRAAAGDQAEGAPGSVQLPQPAVAISAGDSHTAALLKNGDVYVWGGFRDSHGSMGLTAVGRSGKGSTVPVLLPLPEPAVGLASGQDHLVVLTTSGSVITLGCAEQGQLGRLSQRSASRDSRQGLSALLVPAKVTLKFPASKIWAGYHATFAMDAHTDKMYAWGLNNYSQLGITGEKRKAAIFSPTECDAFASLTSECARVACGQHHTIVLDDNGKVYTVGRCEYGRLGLGDAATDATTLTAVPSLQQHRCISIAAGTSSGFAVTDNGVVYSWGMGSEGQLGSGRCEDRPAPAPADVPPDHLAAARAAAVAAGGQHTVLLAVSTSTAEPSEPDADKAPVPTSVPVPVPATAPRGKRRNEQDAEISSTSSQSSGKRPKVNGDDKNDAKMEVDETDKPEPEAEVKEDTPKQSEPAETKQETESDKVSQDEDMKTETTDTSSQDSVSTEKESKTDTATESIKEKSTDVEMKESPVNGTPDAPIESKKVEDVQSEVTPVTTTA